MAKQSIFPEKDEASTEEVLLGLEAYMSEMAPITRSEANEYSSKALEHFSSEELALL